MIGQALYVITAVASALNLVLCTPAILRAVRGRHGESAARLGVLAVLSAGVLLSTSERAYERADVTVGLPVVAAASVAMTFALVDWSAVRRRWRRGRGGDQ